MNWQDCLVDAQAQINRCVLEMNRVDSPGTGERPGEHVLRELHSAITHALSAERQLMGTDPREELGTSLSPRQRQLIDLLLQGADTVEMSRELRIARRTVKAHLNRLFLKLRIHGGGKRVKLAMALYPRERDAEPKVKLDGILTRRERQVAALVALGLRNREIAPRIGTTEHVVKNYLRAIYDKLGLWNRVELSLWYAARAAQSEPGRSPI